MIIVALVLFGLAVADLVRWSPEPVSWSRTVLAGLGGALTVGAVAALSGASGLQAGVAGVVATAMLGPWLVLDRISRRPGWALMWVTGLFAGALGVSGSARSVSGVLEEWYSELGLPIAGTVSADQFLIAFGAALFLLSSANRIVRLMLEAAGTPAQKGEATLRGGRLLGPMERLIVGALVVAGDPAAVAFVIAAKGFLRLPEIRSDVEQAGGGGDQITEYFLIGTFSSLLLAGAMGLLVLAAGL